MAKKKNKTRTKFVSRHCEQCSLILRNLLYCKVICREAFDLLSEPDVGIVSLCSEIDFKKAKHLFLPVLLSSSYQDISR